MTEKTVPREQSFSEGPGTRAGDAGADAGPGDRGTLVAFLALAFVPATLGPGGEELLEGFLIGGQVLLEAVHRLFITLTGLLSAETAAAHGASTCGDT